ncbi:MAG: aldehyde ferredoxin oxidoreductase C-terminal domain-containing protein [Alphaproteobacteria bacterium]|jgi:aldehyde:ferredoxin oxidoreductase|nr:aldehyde ferredoxin oxidoreductase [Rhodospirillaceae bacterium]MDP6023214.1 aldehyde ferredoxin oxidoreductase C-terminal domain-containing protein [Alphaproteobacteria bacterium]MDP6256792.1 aldehyde ferredoxin oxidoreductase C-terminal domain-containing protein [Alphaproteobacteria bacterium]MDP7055919.1 aldehyde ferredoxin oxidoreductase C-terminal domain-containing protein [Alphaproteobacteria bacterium]MDP7229034.1 aldehyde ferredoxin oxidoreductase C-terminal domain-containing protein|tara:strand:- start:1168 stop:2895 length:1728 start_codon:yes stop_codon:yes gene_type:complete
MRKYLHINLDDQSTETEELTGAACIRVGRYFIAKTLLEKGAAKVDPLSPGNPLIFSAGPLAGTNFSNANRISVGCKSPLTGGVKEANAGGTFAFAMGQCEISGITLIGASNDWVIIRVSKEGDISFDDATPFLGMGNIETAAKLFEKYGDKISMGLCSPVGEYGGLVAGISFPDPEGRPVRIAARGGVGAVMGSKKVKAIIVDMNKMPTFHDRKKVMGRVREYGKLLREDKAIEAFSMFGTAMVSDLTNQLGGLPTRNFSDGRLVDASEETLKLGGSYIRDLTIERGGETTHACMPGCMIKCSNVYVDENGEEMVSPLEYESLGLLGSNCGLKDPDDVARTNHQCNDLGIDTIEVGAMLGVLMEAGEGEFGDADFMLAAMDDMRAGNERGRILAQGAGRVGKHYNVARIPVIKNQGISAYDPRAIEVTGISMMLTAQGADHTAGNIPGHKSADMTTEELTEASLDIQEDCAAADSMGLCLFGRSVTNINQGLIVAAVNDAHGTNFDASFMKDLGREALQLEWEFNRQAGFTEDDDELPSFFYDETLEPTGKTARHHSGQVNEHMRKLLGGNKAAS